MVISNYQSLETAQNPHGIQSFKLLDKDYAQIMHLLLQPKEELKPHITPVDVTFYVLEGTLDVMIGKETKTARRDDLIESPKDIVHCLYNHTDKPVRVLVIKTPKPVTPTRFIENTQKEDMMKFKVDQETCIGCGACEATCPAVFRMKNDKAEVILQPVPADKQDCAIEAEDVCPVQAISHE